MEQCFTINLDDLKRMYPHINLDNCQVVSVGGVDDQTQNTQQVILASEDTFVLNESPMQQLVTYQQPTQNTQQSTHYIIQREDDPSQSISTQQIYYSSDISNDQLIQSPQPQQQQLSLSQAHDNSQQNLMLQKTMTPPEQQQTSLIQQQMANQNQSQRIIMQSPNLVLQRQSPQHQQHTTSSIVIRPMATNQPRYIYPTGTYVYNTPPQATIQTNHHHQPQQHQSTASPQNRNQISQQQQTRQVIVSNQTQMQQSGLTYQSPQTPQMQPRASSATARFSRAPVPRTVINQTPKLSPFKGNLMRHPSPALAGTPQSANSSLPEKMTPTLMSTGVARQPRRSTPARPRGGTARGRAASMLNIRPPNPSSVQQQQQGTTISIPQQPATQQIRQIIPPLLPTPQTTRVFNTLGSNISAPRSVITSQVQQRAVPSQAPRMPTPTNTQIQQAAPRYRAPSLLNKPSPSMDIEDSIQAVVVSKANDSIGTATKPYETTVTTYSKLEDDNRDVKTLNGRVTTLTEFKRQQQQRQQQQHSQQTMTATTTTTNKSQATYLNRTNAATVNRLVQNSGTQAGVGTVRTANQTIDERRVGIVRPQPQPQQQHHIIQPISTNKLQNPNSDQKSARMLVILSSGEQRLITFTLPRESCTVQELLEQVGVPFTPKTSIQCVPNPGANIDYVVTVGVTMEETSSELLTAVENTLELAKQQDNGTPLKSVQGSSSSSSTTSNSSTTPEKQSPEAPPKEIPAKIIPGFLAVCQICGYTGGDFAKCERCKRVFTEEPKRVASLKVKPSDDEKKKLTAATAVATTSTVHADLLSRAATKASLAAAGATGSAVPPPLRATKVTITTSNRGRGRGVPRVKHADAEPVILTLSSDEEGDEEKSSKLMKAPPAVPSPPVQRPPMQCEPLIMESMVAPSNMEREDVANVSDSTDQLYTSVSCRIIRFGTYRYDAKEKVFFSSKGVKIIAPSCKNPTDLVVLHIQMREVVRILVHFSKNLNVMFLYTLPTCGRFIRESLEMKSKSADTPYYNPTDRGEPYKRIVLQVESISEESKTVIKSIFLKTALEEINANDANELLVRSCLKDKSIKLDQGDKIENENIRQILIYPPGKGGIPINTEDYMCLAIDQYLNDVIIDFYLNYLHLTVLNDEERDRTHIFSSFFYNRLTTMTTRQRQTDKDVKLTASQKRHARVKNWTKNVNLFDKDFIVIPINEQSHWFLAVICFPRLQGPVTYDTNEPVMNQPTVKKKKTPVERKLTLQIGNTTITPLKGSTETVCLADDSSERDEAEGDESDLASDESESEGQNGSSSSGTASSNIDTNRHRPIKQPLILIFDSLAGASRSRVVATLRDYLTCEYRAKIKEDSNHVFNKFNMPGHCVKVPQQNNFTDCGLYVLQYVESFFKDPIKDYKLPIKQLMNWFETIVVTRKREEISNLLKDLVQQYNPEKLPLPEIALPTQNGKLVETELTDEQAEFEEEEMEDEVEDEDTEEFDSLAGGDTEGELSPEKRNGAKKISLSTASTSLTTHSIALKRPLDIELCKSNQESATRKAARLNVDTN